MLSPARLKRPTISAAAAVAAILAGCGGSGSGESVGYLSLGISDGPIHDATEICVVFDEVEIKGEGPAERIVLDEPEQINLLEFQGMNAAPIFTNNELPAGNYQWIRLGVDAVQGGNGGMGEPLPGSLGCSLGGSYVMTESGAVSNLYIPTSAERGLQLVSGFTIAAGGTTALVAEIDLMKSITEPPGQAPDVKLRPAIRLVNELEVGTLTGRVSPPLATSIDETTELACEPAVYVFDDGVEPNAIEDAVEDPNDPIATALVSESTDESGAVLYRYTVGFLEEGDYDVAFTCDGETFDPAQVKDASIVIGEVTEVNFE